MAKKSDSTTFAFLATFLSIIGFIIALVAKRDDKYVMFYAKQSLVLFIVAVIVGIIGNVLGWVIPFFGWMIVMILQLGIIILWILSWVNALSGTEKEVPVIGNFARSINL